MVGLPRWNGAADRRRYKYRQRRWAGLRQPLFYLLQTQVQRHKASACHLRRLGIQKPRGINRTLDQLVPEQSL